MRSAQAFDVQTDRGAAIRRALGSLASDDEAEFQRIDGLGTVRGDIVGDRPRLQGPQGRRRGAHCAQVQVSRRSEAALPSGPQGRQGRGAGRVRNARRAWRADSPPHARQRARCAGHSREASPAARWQFYQEATHAVQLAGIDYHNAAPLYRLECQLARDTCAPTPHRPFDEFVRAAAQVNAVRHRAALGSHGPDAQGRQPGIAEREPELVRVVPYGPGGGCAA